MPLFFRWSSGYQESTSARMSTRSAVAIPHYYLIKPFGREKKLAAQREKMAAMRAKEQEYTRTQQ